MANNVSHFHSHLLIFFLLLIFASHHVIQGAAKSSTTSFISPSRKSQSQGGGGGKKWIDKNPRRLGLNSDLESSDQSLSWSLDRSNKLRDVASFSKNSRRLRLNPNPKNSNLFLPWNLDGESNSRDVVQWSMDFPKSPRRWMIGSVAPTCTYNECKGCKYKCRAEQVPVEGNDPINSPYHYKCVCHR